MVRFFALADMAFNRDRNALAVRPWSPMILPISASSTMISSIEVCIPPISLMDTNSGSSTPS